ncbi:hypothetical protein [Actomonas aquatica]|uniref:Uncharacterized protein n=1 Tax=Actomonas aquatica TaxID=2866162 RepID=A0ABZ1CAE3_9BACT|nr:hypothetical protein [Opitutus sp. WL0086]WRQ88664.1 hypothetical protein K1X11_004560 [Opitutus sp. WL0086]
MNLITFILLGYVAIALLIALMVRRAPVGYEDDQGFHNGERPLERSTTDSLLAKL